MTINATCQQSQLAEKIRFEFYEIKNRLDTLIVSTAQSTKSLQNSSKVIYPIVSYVKHGD